MVVAQDAVSVHTTANGDSAVPNEILRGLLTQVIAVKGDWIYLMSYAFGWVPLTVNGQPTVTLSSPEWFDQQVKEASTQITLHPDDLENYLTRGTAYLNQKQFDLATADFAHAVELDPKQSRVFEYQGIGDLTIGDYKDAAEAFQKVIGLGQNSAGDFNRLGLALYNNQKTLKDAVTIYQRGIHVTPDWGTLYNNLANAYWGLQNYPEVLDTYQQGINADPYLLLAYINQGIFYEQMGNPDAEIKNFNHVIEIAPFFSTIYMRRGYFYGQVQGDWDAALEDFNHAIELNPQDADAYSALGYYDHVIKGDVVASVADYKHAVALNPTDINAYFNLAGLYGLQGHYQDAINTYTQVLQMPYFDYRFVASVRLYRPQMYAALGQYVDALQDLELYIPFNQSSDYFEVLQLLVEASIYVHRQEYGFALSDYKLAFSKQPEFARDFYTAGTAYRGTPLRENMIPDLLAQIAAHPDQPDLYLQLANLDTEFGRWQDAIDNYNHYLSLSPNPDLQKLVDGLTQLIHGG